VDRTLVQRYTADMLDGGAAPATARARQLGMKRFAAWLVEEGELDADPLAGLNPPKLDVQAVDPLTEDELKALIKACAGKTLRERRDEALVRLIAETGIRASEAIGIKDSELDLTRGLATVYRGKGGKGRIVPFGPQTAMALDRYMRVRRSHVRADSPDLWVGDRGKGFSYDGLYVALRYRAERAGIEGFHPHRLRTTFATRWLDGGGTEGGLMAVAGWSRRDMIDRYVRATASDRAAAEARTLGLGDL
jgi:integrase